MTVEIMKVRNFPFDEDYWFTTEQAVRNSVRKYFAIDWYVDIPERFKPQETPEGSITVECDGTRYMLEEVLGKDKQGEAALVWEDPKYGYMHSVRLEEMNPKFY